MRMLLPLRLVFVAAGLLLATTKANVHLHLHSDTAKHFAIGEREQAIAGMEASLLSLLGFAKRPKPQGPAYVPESLKNFLSNKIQLVQLILQNQEYIPDLLIQCVPFLMLRVRWIINFNLQIAFVFLLT